MRAAASRCQLSDEFSGAAVTRRITDGAEQCEGSAKVGFTSAPLKSPLLGIAGFLQSFTAIFFGDREEVEPAANALYPGT